MKHILWLTLGISAVALLILLGTQSKISTRHLETPPTVDKNVMSTVLDSHGITEQSKRSLLANKFNRLIPDMIVQGRCAAEAPALFNAMVHNSKTHEAEVDYRVRNNIPLGLVREHSGARVEKEHTRESWTGDDAKRALSYPSLHATRKVAYEQTLAQPWK